MLSLLRPWEDGKLLCARSGNCCYIVVVSVAATVVASNSSSSSSSNGYSKTWLQHTKNNGDDSLKAADLTPLGVYCVWEWKVQRVVNKCRQHLESEKKLEGGWPWWTRPVTRVSLQMGESCAFIHYQTLTLSWWFVWRKSLLHQNGWIDEWMDRWVNGWIA